MPNIVALVRWIPLIVPLLVVYSVHEFYGTGLNDADSYIKNLIVAGIGLVDEPSAFHYFGYPNIIEGALLSNLYSYWDGVPWYYLYQTGGHLIASLVIFFCFLSIRPSWFQIVLFSIAFVVCDMTLYLFYKYTTTSAMYAMAAIAVYQQFINGHLRRRVFWSLFLSMCLGGALVRQTSLYMIFCVAGPMVAILSWQKTKESIEGSSLKHRFTQWLLNMSPYFAGLGFVKILDMLSFAIYKFDDGWVEYFRFERLFNLVVDYHRGPSADKIKDVLANIGWSTNDNRLGMWAFPDSSVYSPDNLAELVAHSDMARVAAIGWRSLVQVSGSSVMMTMCVILVAAFFMMSQSRQNLARNIGSILGLSIAICVLTFYYARIYPLTLVVVFLACVMQMMMPVTRQPQERKWKYCFRFGLCLLIGYQGIVIAGKYRSHYDALAADQEAKRSIVQSWKLPDDHLLIMGAIGPFTSQDDGAVFRGKRIFLLGSYSRTPHAIDRLKKLGYTDIYLAMMNRPNTFVTFLNHAQRAYITQYIREHYGKSVRFEPAIGTSVYRVASTE